MIEEQYVSYETAKLAKEKGFDEPCRCYYPCGIKEPTNGIKIVAVKDDHESPHEEAIEYDEGVNFNGTSFCKQDFDVECSAPTQSLLSRWLREEKNICMEIYVSGSGFMWALFDINAKIHKADSNCTGPNSGGRWDSHEEAMEDALQKALSLI